MAKGSPKVIQKCAKSNLKMGQSVLLLPGRTWRAVRRRASDTHPEGRCPARPHEFTCVGPYGPRELGKVEADSLRSHTQPPRGGPGCQTQDTATGTTPTWPPASSSVVCTLYNTPPEDFSSCTQNQEELFE